MAIQIVNIFGAEYLRYNLRDKPEFLQEPLKTMEGDIINIGDKIISLGPKPRTMFELIDGKYMTYQGIYVHKTMTKPMFQSDYPVEIRYAIFDVPEHNKESKNILYKYAFTIVENPDDRDKVMCFLIGTKGPGCRDVLLDPVKRWKDD